MKSKNNFLTKSKRGKIGEIGKITLAVGVINSKHQKLGYIPKSCTMAVHQCLPSSGDGGGRRWPLFRDCLDREREGGERRRREKAKDSLP